MAAKDSPLPLSDLNFPSALRPEQISRAAAPVVRQVRGWRSPDRTRTPNTRSFIGKIGRLEIIRLQMAGG
jgi:hypothetical protein